MYEKYFGLNRQPFAAAPDVDLFVAHSTVRSALEKLLRCVRSGQGIGVLTGEAGCGKTILCRRLMSELGSGFARVFLPHSNFPTRRALLQAVLYELDQPYVRLAAQELRLELTRAMRSVHAEREAVVLIVDEAHDLNDRLLEEIRTMTTIGERGRMSIRVVLSGQLPLEEKLLGPSLAALNQRIRCQVSLERLTQQESARYIAERMQRSAGDLADVFTPDAIQAICRASDGLPRCLNQLCDQALVVAFKNGHQRVGAEAVRVALDELRQLPLRWNDLPGWAAEPFDSEETIRTEDSIIGGEFDPQQQHVCDDFARVPDRKQSTIEVIEIGAADADEASTEFRTIEPARSARSTQEMPMEFETGDATSTKQQIVDMFGDGPRPALDRNESVALGPIAEIATDFGDEARDGVLQPVCDIGRSTECRTDSNRTNEKLSIPLPPTASEAPVCSTAAPERSSAMDAQVTTERGAWRFEEIPVLDRYALLDAGRELPAELSTPQRAARSADVSRGVQTTRSVASPAKLSLPHDDEIPESGDAALMIEQVLNSRVTTDDDGMQWSGDDLLFSPGPDELIDSLLPLLNEQVEPVVESFHPNVLEAVGDSDDAIAANPMQPVDGMLIDGDSLAADDSDDDPQLTEDETALIEDIVVPVQPAGSPLLDEVQGSELGILERLNDASRLLLEADAPTADDDLVTRFSQDVPDELLPYDVVQPESSDESTRHDLPEFGDGPHRPYSQLFSQLRRRQQQS